MMKFICLLVLCIPSAALATMNVMVVDPSTGSIGLANSSSNPWGGRIAMAKGKGIFTEAGYGVDQFEDIEPLVQAGWSAQKLVDAVPLSVWNEKSRWCAVTTDGAIASVIAPQGCYDGNQVCGRRVGPNFLVMGGGLEEGVLEAAVAKLTSLPAEMPLQCKLVATLRAIYKAGGEKLGFRSASVTVDDPRKPEFMHWIVQAGDMTTPWDENQMLSKIAADSGCGDE